MATYASETENAWAAGLFEGEGTLAIARYSRDERLYTRPVVTLTMTDQDVIEFFHSRWKGSVCPHQAKGKARLAWRWTINSRPPIRAFLADVGPEFRTERVKAKAALLIEDMDDRVQGCRNDSFYLTRCLDRYNRMKALNHRGTGGMHFLLPSGKTVAEEVLPAMVEAYRLGQMPSGGMLQIGGAS